MLALWVLAAPSAPEAATPVPEFSPDGVAVNDVVDTFDRLREFLATYQSEVGAIYHVALVALSDRLDRPGPDYGDETGEYIDSVVAAWRPHVDPAHSVIIVMALENRDIIVHPGSQWARLGFENEVIVEVIDNSPFAPNARAGDYNEALIQLIMAIDRHLAGRISAREAQAQRAFDLIEAQRNRLQELDEILEEAPFDVSQARAHTDEVPSLLALAEQELAVPDRSHQALLRAQLAEQRLDAAFRAYQFEEQALQDRQEDARRARRLIAETRDRLGLLVERLDSASFEASNVRELCDETSGLLDHAGVLLSENDQPRESLQLARVADERVGMAEASWLRAEQRHQFWWHTVPIAVGTVVLLFLVMVFIAFFRRRAARGYRAKRLVAQWRSRLDQAGQNLLAMENAHPLILGRADLVERFVGETAEPIHQVARQVDDIYLAYETAQDLLSQAETALRKNHWFTSRGFLLARRLLTQQEVVARTEEVKEHRLFLPDQREVRLPAPQLLEKMDQWYSSARKRIEYVEAQFDAIWQRLSAVVEILNGLDAMDVGLSEHDLDTSNYRCIHHQLKTNYEELKTKSQTDPLGIEDDLETLKNDVDTLANRYHRLDAVVSQLTDEVRPKAQEVSTAIEQLRETSNLKLAEPGFEPDLMLDTVDDLDAEAWEVAQTGGDQTALDLVNEALDILKEIATLVVRTRASKEESPRQIQELLDTAETLQERLPERRERIRSLQGVHSDEALQPALDNAEQAEAAIRFAKTCLHEAREAVDESAQRYLSGAELVRRGRQTLEEVALLYQEIEDKAAELAEHRNRAELLLDEANHQLAEIDSLIDGNESFASEMTEQPLKTLEQSLASLGKAVRVARPNWAALHVEIEVQYQLSQEILARAREELAAYQKVQTLAPALAARQEGLKTLLDSSLDDRPQANTYLDTAREVLVEADRIAGQQPPLWIEVYQRYQAAEMWLDKCKKAAETDFSLAQQAREAIASADSAIRSADQPYGFGIRASLKDSRTALDEAKSLLTKLDYEKALEQAASATKKALVAQQQAVQRADNQRRAYSPPTRSRGSSPSPTRSRSSRSSWSSRSSSFGSSSSRRSRSFGSSSSHRSSSGRSSFGSSSGRSSFGRSSGRSKW